MRSGGIVSIGTSNSKQYGLVMSCEPLTDLKQAVRNADFTLKKVRGGGRIFTREFLRAVFDIAQWHACGVGAVLHALAPQWTFEDAGGLRAAHSPNLEEGWDEVQHVKREKNSTSKTITEQVIGVQRERYEHINKTVHDLLSTGKSCLTLTPTVIETVLLGEYLQNSLNVKTDCEVIILHGELTPIRARNAWRKIATSEKPIVVVGTPAALSCPLKNIGAIILERAGAYGYHRTEQRPYLDLSECARLYAEQIDAVFISLSPAPLISTIYTHLNPLPKRKGVDQCKIIDMRPPAQSPDAPIKKHKFQLFAPETITAIKTALEADGNVLLICARRGLATSTICDDCGSAVTCKKCDSMLVLRDTNKTNASRFFQCNRCGTESSTKILCETCKGWRLKMLGVGTEGVAQEARILFPFAKIITLEEKTSNGRNTAKMAREFADSRGAILVSTEGILQHLYHPVAQIIVVSIDSFLCAPEFSASEHAARLLASCRDTSAEPLIIQTRLPEHPAVAAIKNNDWSIFIRQEHKARKQLSYPPYSALVRISLEGSAEKIHTLRDSYIKILAQHNPQNFSGHVVPNPRAKTPRAREHILLRIPAEKWPDKKLITFLRLLPQSVEISINPQSVFRD